MAEMYYWHEHRDVVENVMIRLSIPAHAVRSISLIHHVRPSDAPFIMFDVYGHSRPIPREVRSQLEILGCVWLRHDDTPLRNTLERVRREKR